MTKFTIKVPKEDIGKRDENFIPALEKNPSNIFKNKKKYTRKAKHKNSKNDLNLDT